MLAIVRGSASFRAIVNCGWRSVRLERDTPPHATSAAVVLLSSHRLLAAVAVQKPIVNDAYGKGICKVLWRCRCDANHLAGAKYLRVLLTGDLERHLEDGLQQFPLGGAVLGTYEQSRLADVLYGAWQQLVDTLAAKLDRDWNP